jgi:hypothetical protein
MFLWDCELVALLRDLRGVEEEWRIARRSSRVVIRTTIRCAPRWSGIPRNRLRLNTPHHPLIFQKSPEQSEDVYENKGSHRKTPAHWSEG